MNNKIGIKNFRVFKGMTEFEIRPLTILTGPNNSGKSSLTKLILAFQTDHIFNSSSAPAGTILARRANG